MRSSAALLRRIQYGAAVTLAFALPLGKSLTETAAITGIVVLIARLLCDRQRDWFPHSALTIVLVAWLGAGLLSMQHSVDLMASVKGLQKLVKYFGVYLMLLSAIDNPRHLDGVITAAALGFGLIVLDVLWQAVFNRDLLLGNPVGDALNHQVERVQATFHHPAELGTYLESVAPLLVVWSMTRTQRWRRGIAAAFVALTIIVEVLNRSRGGMFGFLVGLALLGWLLRRWIPYGIAAATMALQTLTLPPAVKAWAATMPSFLDRLTEPDRPIIWQAALNMFKAHPIVGVGINTFVKAYARYCLPNDPFGRGDLLGPYAHNQYLHLAAELGLVGLVVFGVLLCVVALAIRRTLAQRATTPELAAIGSALAAGLAGYLVGGLFESSLYHGRASMIFWWLIGLIMAVDRISAAAASSASAANSI